MSTETVPVIKFLFQNDWSVLDEAVKLHQPYEVESLDTSNELATFLSDAPVGLVVASLRDKNDLIQIATLLKSLKRISPNTYLKIIVVNFANDKQFEKAINKLGILDLLDPKIQTKALRFKIDFVMKSIQAHLRKLATVSPANNGAKASQETNKGQDKKILENTPAWQEAMDIEDDIWILKNDTDCKKVLSRWLVRFMGPSPYVAQWVETATPGVWKFEFKGTSEDYIFGKGSWFFRGDQKPDFIWNENLWLFTGGAFELFYKDGNQSDARLKLKDKVLSISKNSEYAKTKEAKIIESFDKDLVFKKDMSSKLDMETTDKEAEKYANLEGKGKTDTLGGGPLSGKGQTSNLSSDPLSMDLEPGENTSSSDPLSQKTATAREKTHWNGKNTYEKEGKADLDHKADQKTAEGAALSLESSTAHQKNYKNHNEPEKFEAKEMGGKSSTDKLENLTSPELKKHSEKAKSQSDLGGKSSTDKLENLTSPELKKHSEKAKSQSDLGGKSSTDKIDGHLGSPDAKKKQNEVDKQSGSELNGKGHTDKLPGHLSSPNSKDKSQESRQGSIEETLNATETANKAANKAHKDQRSLEKEDNAKGNSRESSGRQQSESESESLKKEPKDRDTKDKESHGKPNDRKSKERTLELVESAEARESKKAKEDREATEERKRKEGPEAKQTRSFGEERDGQNRDPKGNNEPEEGVNSGHDKENKIEKQASEVQSKEKKDVEHAQSSKGGTDKLSSNYTSRSKNNGPDKDKDNEEGEKGEEAIASQLLLLKKEKNVPLEKLKLVPTELDDAIQTAVITSLLIQDSKKISCTLDDYFDQSIIFSTKDEGLVPAKSVSLNLNFNYMNKDTNLKFSGDITLVEKDADGDSYITVEISKENVSAFNTFMKLYEIRQASIDLYLKNVKGS